MTEEIKQALCVDAACSCNPGPMEYRGVHIPSGKEVFRFGPIQGTNNIGEFLAIVHALALMQQKNISMPIYSDSVSGMAWVRNRKAKTTLSRTAQTEQALDLVARAENWLRTNQVQVPILKWDTENWGEIPADFGRK
jgi:ribonuclease HI